MTVNKSPLRHLQSTDSLYISIPFFIARAEMRVYGVFLNSPAKTRFDIGKSIPDRYMFATEEGRLDYYVSRMRISAVSSSGCVIA